MPMNNVSLPMTTWVKEFIVSPCFPYKKIVHAERNIEDNNKTFLHPIILDQFSKVNTDFHVPRINRSVIAFPSKNVMKLL